MIVALTPPAFSVMWSFTVRLAVAVLPLYAAVTTTAPPMLPLALKSGPAMTPTCGLVEDHCATLAMSPVEPLAKWAVALNVCETAAPFSLKIDALGGSIVIDVICESVPPSPLPNPPPPPPPLPSPLLPPSAVLLSPNPPLLPLEPQAPLASATAPRSDARSAIPENFTALMHILIP